MLFFYAYNFLLDERTNKFHSNFKSQSYFTIIGNDKEVTSLKNEDPNANILETMPVGRLFIKMAVPAVLSQLINILYNLVDKMFIGHMKVQGAESLASLGVTTPVILFLSAFAALVSMGGAPKTAISLGRNEKDTAERIMGSCTALLIGISVLLTAGMLIWGKNILLVFGASEDTIIYAVDYMRIYCLGTVFIQLSLGLNAFITTQGFSKISMLNVTIGAVINVILDPIMIYWCNLGIKGAALATVIAQVVSCIFIIRFLISEKSEIKLKRKYIRIDWKLLLPCILLGTSPALMQITENMVAISFNTVLQRYGGDMAVASMSILNSVMQFVMLFLPGLVQGAQPILSYNLGAGQIERVRKTFSYLLLSCITGSSIIWGMCMLFPEKIIGIFTNDAVLCKYSVAPLRTYLCMLCIYGIQVACQYSFVALDQARIAIFLTIWRKIILLIPLIFILPHFVMNPTIGVFFAEPIADFIAVCTTGTLFYRYYRKNLKRDK